jgi:membrane associated rhomboid family serine protease
LKITAVVARASGPEVWFFDSGVMAGARWAIIGYIGYLFVRGLVAGPWWNLTVALLTGVLYGWQVSDVLPFSDTNISWQAHLFGFIGGVIGAVLFGRPRQDHTTPALVNAPASPVV